VYGNIHDSLNGRPSARLSCPLDRNRPSALPLCGASPSSVSSAACAVSAFTTVAEVYASSAAAAYSTAAWKDKEDNVPFVG